MCSAAENTGGKNGLLPCGPPCTEAIGSRLQRILQVTVELKNDLAIMGTMHSVDQYLNIKLDNVKVVNQDKFPHMVRPLTWVWFCLLVCYQHAVLV